MPPGPRATRRLAAAGALALTVAACGDADGDTSTDTAAAASEGAVQVVATTSILGDVAQQLVGDDGEVIVLMGPGVDPHAYEPSAQDAARMREADLVVANGLQLEESLLDQLDAAETEQVPVFELAPQVDPLAYEESEVEHDDHADEGEDDHGHGAEDPHVWFDAQRMAEGITLLADELAEVAPAVAADEWAARADAYTDELLTIDAELADAFAAVPEDDRVMVTNHDALGYLAARYDIEVVGTVIPGASTQTEADARQFAELAETVEEAGIDTIFAENTDSARLAEQLASEVVGRGDLEVEVVQVATDALGRPGTATETYLGLLEETGRTIAANLTG
jgi:ABC-type Zn uptake system ZnuABC Zn-binding protein ZnuA